MAALPLGPWSLELPIGIGGMGEVWRGTHLAQGVPVAVKVLLADDARDPLFLDIFRNEIRAVAGLDHPNIVAVLDYGQIPEETAHASGGRLVAGSPYLAMELCCGGSLLGWVRRPRRWDQVRGLLLALLDALAHAHARGVIHRDIKPGNVLLSAPSDLRPGPKLADFGIAHRLERAELNRTSLGAGTPAFMSPEQAAGRWRDFGPWTDLYAVGALTLSLLQGELAPDDLLWTSWGSNSSARPAFAVPTPNLLSDWLEAMLADDPGRRFQRAADAAYALRALGEPPGPRSALVEEELTLEDGTTDPEVKPGLPDLAPRPRADPAPPPLPDTWRHAAQPPPPLRLRGAGLGLFGLRPVPLVGRRGSQDALWSELRQVEQHGGVRVALLRGPAGCGKSRLAAWLAERAHEVGAVEVTRVSHGPTPGPGDGLRAAVVNLLSCQSLPPDGARSRALVSLSALGGLDGATVRALLDLVAPPEDDGAGPVRFADPRERYAAISRLLWRRARSRVALVLIDDVQWGLDTLGFVAWLLRAQGNLSPTLVLMTAQDEALAERSAERALLSGLRKAPQVTSWRVGPLPRSLWESLVDGVLPLERDLRAELATRAAGNPLFAVQLAGDWVQRELLVVDRRGFRLRPGVDVGPQKDLTEVWTTRIERVLAALPPEDALALELAAALGLEVDDGEWRAVCTHAGLQPSMALPDALLVRGLARSGLGSWSFAHAMLREALLVRAGEAGRLVAAHRSCAAVLARHHSRAGVPERLGRHRLSAGDVEGALAPLLEGASAHTRAGAYGPAEALLLLRDEALQASGLPADSVAWGEGFIAWGVLMRAVGDLHRATVWLERAEEEARRYGWERLLVIALTRRADTFWTALDLQKAVIVAREAVARAEAARLGPEGVMARLALATACAYLGETAEARALLRGVLLDCAAHRLAEASAVAHTRLAELALDAGALEEAHEEAAAARSGFAGLGRRRDEGRATVLEGEIARARGDLNAAEAAYRAARGALVALDPDEGLLPSVNLSLVLVERGRYAEARAGLDAAGSRADALGDRWLALSARAVLLPVCADAEDWSAFDRHLSMLVGDDGKALPPEADIARMAELAGRIASLAGQPDRARRALRLAREVLVALNRREALARIERALADLG